MVTFTFQDSNVKELLTWIAMKTFKAVFFKRGYAWRENTNALVNLLCVVTQHLNHAKYTCWVMNANWLSDVELCDVFMHLSLYGTENFIFFHTKILLEKFMKFPLVKCLYSFWTRENRLQEKHFMQFSSSIWTRT